MTDTIFALSTGAPPAAIAVIRISGPRAGEALDALAGQRPTARRATLATLRATDGEVLDRALALWFPGPGTATGEDLAELHCHGGRAVVAAIERELAAIPGLRRAEPGEFTRRAFANGQIDLAEAEGLADLLSAETELQRRSAIAMTSGALSDQVDGWRAEILDLSAAVEAVLDFGDEDDVADLPHSFAARLKALGEDLGAWLARPRAEQLRAGFRVVIAGPPNAGKSTLFNALVDEDAAIVTPIAGTTRDTLVRSVAFDGVPFQFIDTAGLREDAADPVEAIGIDRAGLAIAQADITLWLGAEGERPPDAWNIAARIDAADHAVKENAQYRVSALTGEGLPELRAALVGAARTALPKAGAVALTERQAKLIGDTGDFVREAGWQRDPLLIAEMLRRARSALDRLVGKAATEDMLDTLFARFCIGK